MKVNSSSIADGNEAAASVAYRLVENIVIYPITPSSPMAECCDEWSHKGKANIWGTIPDVIEMQSEGGASGAVHGSLQAGAMTTTFTASQGLLLMIPNMYKIAGELTPFCMHVTARSLATHALSIFGDHSDVMACRQTGFAMLASGSVQEAHDMAAIAHASTLETRIPFLHFFDGFRTSHEINTYQALGDEDLNRFVKEEGMRSFRSNALTPDAPKIRGTAQNPDVFFQAREAINPIYDGAPAAIEAVMKRFESISGRSYNLFEYHGAKDAERVIVIMGSGAETVRETAQALNAKGAKVGVIIVRLFRPFSMEHLAKALPKTVKSLAVLDRTKEPGASGEPLFQDVLCSLQEAKEAGLLPEPFQAKVIGGRYGLGSKEFNPAMAKAVYDEMNKAEPKRRFTVGIEDDVSRLSLDVDESFDLESEEVFRAVFYGLGADGTVGANKNSIKIIGGETEQQAQAYFVYDSKKSGGMTVSHLRFGPKEIRAPYLIKQANFVACHQDKFMDQVDILNMAAPKSVFLLNSTYPADQVFEQLSREAQKALIEKSMSFYTIDAYAVAKEAGMGQRINTVMQTCFFAISGVLPREEAIVKIKDSIEKTYGKKGRAIVEKNFEAVDKTLAKLQSVTIPEHVSSVKGLEQAVSEQAPDFVKKVSAMMLSGKGDLLPVSAFPLDGTWPTATSQWEKRSIANEVPAWDQNVCIQCNKCSSVCPHSAIRSKFYKDEHLAGAPQSFKSKTFKSKEHPGQSFTIQVAPEDCTGCKLCVQVCPAKDKANPKFKALNMQTKKKTLEQDKRNYEFFLNLPEPKLGDMKLNAKNVQFKRPLFEYSGACSGCGETPYIKMLTQLFGDRLMIANATGCSSIYGGNLPTTPYCTDDSGRGPAWSNSLFEDNAEFGMGFRLALDTRTRISHDLLRRMAPQLGETLVTEILNAKQDTEEEVGLQRDRVATLEGKLRNMTSNEALWLKSNCENLVRKSVWIVGGDGWAYDIGFGGLDHVMATGRNVNILVLDTEVYSNTGGQQSKATPIGAVAKFAASGKPVGKKDLGMMAMSYGNVYVASVSLGAKDSQVVQAFQEAEAYPGPSIIMAYSHCIAHGYNLESGLSQQKKAVDSGYWPLYRFDPRQSQGSKLKLDSKAPKLPLSQYMENEGRFRMLQLQNPDRSKELMEMGQQAIYERYEQYRRLANSDTEAIREERS
jgi:pyruvate-ferredoxin/flavodoxin oxidoreductase